MRLAGAACRDETSELLGAGKPERRIGDARSGAIAHVAAKKRAIAAAAGSATVRKLGLAATART